MTVTSMKPSTVSAFVDTGRIHESSLADTATSVGALRRQVLANSMSAMEVTTSQGSFDSLVDDMRAASLFADEVRVAVVAADQSSIDYATASNSTVAAALAAAGVTLGPSSVVFQELSISGLPQHSGYVDDPINGANGNFVHCEVDFHAFGAVQPLSLVRWYNSNRVAIDGYFGRGWTSILDIRLDPESVSGSVFVTLEDGSVVRFSAEADRWVCPSNGGLSLSLSSGIWELTTPAVRMVFGEAGELTSLADEGSTLTFSTTTSGRRVVESRTGRWVDFSIDENRVLGAKLSTGLLFSYEYTADTLRVVSAGGIERSRYQYDGANRLTSNEDADGVFLFENRYDSSGRVESQMSVYGLESVYEYGPNGLLIVSYPQLESDRGEVKNALVHDSGGRVRSVVDAHSESMRFSYDGDNRVEAKDRAGQVWTSTFDEKRRLTGKSDPRGGVRYEWDDSDRVIQVSDAVDRIVNFSYEPGGDADPDRIRFDASDNIAGAVERDSHGRVVRLQSPSIDVSLSYSEAGSLAKASGSDGADVEIEYDESLRPISVVTTSLEPLVIGYDELDRLTSFQQGKRWGRFEYSRAGRITAGDTNGASWEASYSADTGLIERLTLGDGSWIQFDHDLLGNVTSVRNELGETCKNEYDELSRLVRCTGPAGESTSTSYDTNGRVTSTTTGSASYRQTLDGHGRAIEVSLPNGAAVALERDALGRLSRVVTPDGSLSVSREPIVTAIAEHRQVLPVPPRSFSFDDQSRLSSCSDAAEVETTFTRDSAGRFAASTTGQYRVAVQRQTGRIRTIERTGIAPVVLTRDGQQRLVEIQRAESLQKIMRDSSGQVVRVTAGGTDVVFDRDWAGRIVRSEQGATFVQFERDALGRLTGVADQDGLETNYVYGATGGLSSVSQSGLETVVLLHEDGRQVAVAAERRFVGLPAPSADERGRVTATPSGTQLSYDAAGRLSRTSPPVGESTDYFFNDLGLLSAERSGAVSRRYTYDSVGRPTAIDFGDGEWQLGYDEDGRRKSITIGDGSEYSLTWDGLDRLTAVTSQDGSLWDIEYDPLGRPRTINGVSIRWDPLTGRPTAVGDTQYVYAGLSVYRLDGANTAADNDPYGDADFGSTRLDVVGPGILRAGPFQFMGARVYDSSSRHFLTPDPVLAPPGALNAASPYSFANHDPINYLDPFGLRPFSDAEYQQLIAQQQNGAWDAIVDDPLGSLVMVGTVAVGVALLFTPVPMIGAGILVGAGLSAGLGIATGTFNPRAVALSGMVGALPGGAGLSMTKTIALGAALGGGENLVDQTIIQGNSVLDLDFGQLVLATSIGGVSAGGAAKVSTVLKRSQRIHVSSQSRAIDDVAPALEIVDAARRESDARSAVLLIDESNGSHLLIHTPDVDPQLHLARVAADVDPQYELGLRSFSSNHSPSSSGSFNTYAQAEDYYHQARFLYENGFADANGRVQFQVDDTFPIGHGYQANDLADDLMPSPSSNWVQFNFGGHGDLTSGYPLMVSP